MSHGIFLYKLYIVGKNLWRWHPMTENIHSEQVVIWFYQKLLQSLNLTWCATEKHRYTYTQLQPNFS